MKDDTRFLREIVFHHGLPATKALRCGLQILQEVDLRETWRQLGVPTLHALGERDNLVPAAVKDDLLALQPSAQVAVVSGAAHLPFLSAPAEFLACVNAFLAAQVPG